MFHLADLAAWTCQLVREGTHVIIPMFEPVAVMTAIVTGGENVYSVEVENVIAQHPAVATAAVIGVPERRGASGCTPSSSRRPGRPSPSAQLTAFCRERLAGYKLPRTMELVDGLPVSAAGKVLERELRKPFSEGHDRAVQGNGGRPPDRACPGHVSAHTAGVISRASSGATEEITVNGEPVADLIPLQARRSHWTSKTVLLERLVQAQADPELRDELSALSGGTGDLGPVR